MLPEDKRLWPRPEYVERHIGRGSRCHDPHVLAFWQFSFWRVPSAAQAPISMAVVTAQELNYALARPRGGDRHETTPGAASARSVWRRRVGQGHGADRWECARGVGEPIVHRSRRAGRCPANAGASGATERLRQPPATSRPGSAIPTRSRSTARTWIATKTSSTAASPVHG